MRHRIVLVRNVNTFFNANMIFRAELLIQRGLDFGDQAVMDVGPKPQALRDKDPCPETAMALRILPTTVLFPRDLFAQFYDV